MVAVTVVAGRELGWLTPFGTLPTVWPRKYRSPYIGAHTRGWMVTSRSIRRIPAVVFLGVMVWLATTVGSEPVLAAPGDPLGTVDLTGNGGQSVGGTFDGTYYIAPLSGGGWGSSTLRIYSPPAGGGGGATLVASKTVKDGSGTLIRISGVAWDPNRGKVWGADSNTVWLIDIGDPTVTGDALAVFQFNPNVGGSSIIDGLAYDGNDDTLYYSPDQVCCVWQFSLGTAFNPGNPPLGTLMNTVVPKNAAGVADGNISGVVIGAGNTLYVGRPLFNEIRRVDKTTGDFLAQFVALSPSAWVEDLTCDPVTYAPNEAILAKYAFNSLYEAFEVEAGTCPLAVERVDLSIDKTASPDPVTAGEQLTYTIMVTNHSDLTATGVTVTDSLPPGVTVDSASAGCSIAGNPIVCDVPDIPPGDTAQVIIVVTVGAATAGPLTNPATVEGGQFDPNTGNNTVEIETTVNPRAGDTTPPRCEVIGVNIAHAAPPTNLLVEVQDSGSGLDAINGLVVSNATVNIPAFSVGTNAVVQVVADKIDESKRSRVEIQAIDVAGNSSTCDPVLATLTRDSRTLPLTGIPSKERYLTISPSDPATSLVMANVNGSWFRTSLGHGSVTIDLGSAMTSGSDNTVTVWASSDTTILLADAVPNNATISAAVRPWWHSAWSQAPVVAGG